MMNVLDLEARQWMREESMREIAPKALTDIEDAQNYLNCWVTEFREGTEAQTIRAYRKDFLEGQRAEEAMRCVSEWRQSEKVKRGRSG